MDKLEKAMKGLECCSLGLFCPDEECPYEVDKEEKQENCISNLCRDAMALIKEYEGGRILSAPTGNGELIRALEKVAENMPGEDAESFPAHIVPRELLLCTWGHGWEETHFRGDDEDPESVELVECVWINGHIMNADGSDADADSDWWRENYGKRYGVRIWTGDKKPRDKQREETPWTNR